MGQGEELGEGVFFLQGYNNEQGGLGLSFCLQGAYSLAGKIITGMIKSLEYNNSGMEKNMGGYKGMCGRLGKAVLRKCYIC